MIANNHKVLGIAPWTPNPAMPQACHLFHQAGLCILVDYVCALGSLGLNFRAKTEPYLKITSSEHLSIRQY